MPDIHLEEHSSPIKTPKQLVIVVIAAFAVPIALIVMLIQLITGRADLSPDNPALSDEAVAKRLKPVGDVAIDPDQPAPVAAAPAAPVAVAAAPAAPAKPAPAADKGKSVYDATCMACHGTGIAGAPKAGDKVAWALRLKSGMPALYTSALKGKNAMPPKGGNLSLSDADVKSAVDYLVGLVK